MSVWLTSGEWFSVSVRILVQEETKRRVQKENCLRDGLDNSRRTGPDRATCCQLCSRLCDGRGRCYSLCSTVIILVISLILESNHGRKLLLLLLFPCVSLNSSSVQVPRNKRETGCRGVLPARLLCPSHCQHAPNSLLVSWLESSRVHIGLVVWLTNLVTWIELEKAIDLLVLVALPSRFYKNYELPLLVQSVIMNITMFLMIHLCVKVRRSNALMKIKDRVFTGKIIESCFCCL